MNCNCVEDFRVKMIEHFKPEAGDNVEATCQSLGINFETGKMSLSIPWTIRGTTRHFKTAKGYSTYLVASFCPFCGVSTTAKKEGAQ